MQSSANAITYLDASRLHRALLAGIHHVIQRKGYINKINVFPVPDGDTGTNLAFTLRAIEDALTTLRPTHLGELMRRVADASLDGARGNSGAILAEYFQGFSDAAGGSSQLSPAALAEAAQRGAKAAWSALANPVQGTMPTVLSDFADELTQRVQQGIGDIRLLLQHGLERARVSLAGTPDQLPALKAAGVVDAGGQGFVDFLEGIWTYIEAGTIDSVSDLEDGLVEDPIDIHQPDEIGDHRFCTECMILGEDIDREALRRELTAMDCSSLVIAGSKQRLRVHIHVNNPAQVFLNCENHGQVTRQKADDMQRQFQLGNHPAKVVVVTDSAADIPEDELERLNINMVPVRLVFGDQDYLDKVSITPREFYTKLAESPVLPQTSQPPPGDFRRQYEFLSSHGYQVVSVGVSRQLSGTLQAAEHAAARFRGNAIRVVDSMNGAAGQGLVALYAAEAALAGLSIDAVVQAAEKIRSRTLSYAFISDLSWGVRGGRIPKLVKTLADWFNLRPVLCNTPQGKLTARGAVFGRRNRVQKFANYVVKRLQEGVVYRVLIGHSNAEEAAQLVKRQLLQAHPQIHSCMITDTGPAVGVHLGPGGLVVGIQEWIYPRELVNLNDGDSGS